MLPEKSGAWAFLAHLQAKSWFPIQNAPFEWRPPFLYMMDLFSLEGEKCSSVL